MPAGEQQPASEYDPAISFFVDGLGFELAEDSPALSNDGRPKRWVVVRPGAATGLLLGPYRPRGVKAPGRARNRNEATIIS